MKEKSAAGTRAPARNIFYSLMVVLAAQININLFIDNFKISVGVICLPVFLFLLEDFAVIPVTVLSAAGVFLSRLLSYWFMTGVIEDPGRSFPEAAFYLVYGCFIFLLQRAARRSTLPLSKNRAVIPLFVMDYVSNLIELILRLGVQAFSFKTQLSILLVAFVRTVIIWITLTVFDRYRLTLLNREHAERYQRLIVLIARLNSEVVWMQKNASLIEDTMNTSYQLYHRMQEEKLDSSLSFSALSIARDIHEIKKEYLLIMRGLSEALETEFTESGMAVSDLLTILTNALSAEARSRNKLISFNIGLKDSLYTDNPYAFMSVFHNLFTNALEASDKDCLELSIQEDAQKDSYIFSVTDDGPGISSEDMCQIFEPGFSTKINFETGAISRGLGLNIVKDIVENQFSGTTTLTSDPGCTSFSISIPKDRLEVMT